MTKLIILSALLLVGEVSAKCLPNEQSEMAICRYPAGDAWCAQNGYGNLYAYNDSCLAKDRDPEPVAPDSTINRTVDQVLSSIKDNAVGAAKGVVLGCSAVGETAKTIAELRDKGTGKLSAKILAKAMLGAIAGIAKITSYVIDYSDVAAADIHEKISSVSALNTASSISASAFSDSSEFVDIIYNSPGLSGEDLKTLGIYGCLLKVGFAGK